MEKALFLVILCVFLDCNLAFNRRLEDDDAIKSDQLFDDVIGNAMIHDDNHPAITKRTVQGECNHQLKFPESPSITEVNNNKMLDGAFGSIKVTSCKPQPFTVNIPAQSHVNVHPHAIDLNRCFGKTNTILEECTAIKKEKVTVQVWADPGGGQWAPTKYEMWEHTECASKCKLKAQDCNENQSIDNNKCECTCNLSPNTVCSNSKKIYNHNKCACQCITVLKCDIYTEWDPNTCSCRCAQCIRDMCAKHNKIIDEKLCKCT